MVPAAPVCRPLLPGSSCGRDITPQRRPYWCVESFALACVAGAYGTVHEGRSGLHGSCAT